MATPTGTRYLPVERPKKWVPDPMFPSGSPDNPDNPGYYVIDWDSASPRQILPPPENTQNERPPPVRAIRPANRSPNRSPNIFTFRVKSAQPRNPKRPRNPNSPDNELSKRLREELDKIGPIPMEISKPESGSDVNQLMGELKINDKCITNTISFSYLRKINQSDKDFSFRDKIAEEINLDLLEQLENKNSYMSSIDKKLFKKLFEILSIRNTIFIFYEAKIKTSHSQSNNPIYSNFIPLMTGFTDLVKSYNTEIGKNKECNPEIAKQRLIEIIKLSESLREELFGLENKADEEEARTIERTRVAAEEEAARVAAEEKARAVAKEEARAAAERAVNAGEEETPKEREKRLKKDRQKAAKATAREREKAEAKATEAAVKERAAAKAAEAAAAAQRQLSSSRKQSAEQSLEIIRKEQIKKNKEIKEYILNIYTELAKNPEIKILLQPEGHRVLMFNPCININIDDYNYSKERYKTLYDFAKYIHSIKINEIVEDKNDVYNLMYLNMDPNSKESKWINYTATYKGILGILRGTSAPYIEKYDKLDLAEKTLQDTLTYQRNIKVAEKVRLLLTRNKSDSENLLDVINVKKYIEDVNRIYKLARELINEKENYIINIPSKEKELQNQIKQIDKEKAEALQKQIDIEMTTSKEKAQALEEQITKEVNATLQTRIDLKQWMVTAIKKGVWTDNTDKIINDQVSDYMKSSPEALIENVARFEFESKYSGFFALIFKNLALLYNIIRFSCGDEGSGSASPMVTGGKKKSRKSNSIFVAKVRKNKTPTALK